MDKVSIIIPVYNCDSYLKECLESVSNQSHENIEVLLIDDGSTDNSGNICDEYSKKDHRFRVIHIKNGGVSNARNIGISHATGYYVTFVDADDLVSQDFIERMLSCYSDDIQLVVCNYSKLYKNTEVYIPYNIENKISADIAKKELFKDNSIRGFSCNKLFILDIIKKNNLLFDVDIKICEDLLFCFTYLNMIKNAYIINEKHYFYRMRKSSSLNNNSIKSDLTVFDSYKKMYNIDSKVYSYSEELYTYLYFKYYKELKKNKLLDTVNRVKLSNLLMNKKISIKSKMKSLYHRYFSIKAIHFLKEIKQKKYSYFE